MRKLRSAGIKESKVPSEFTAEVSQELYLLFAHLVSFYQAARFWNLLSRWEAKIRTEDKGEIMEKAHSIAAQRHMLCTRLWDETAKKHTLPSFHCLDMSCFPPEGLGTYLLGSVTRRPRKACVGARGIPQLAVGPGGSAAPPLSFLASSQPFSSP